MTFLAGSQVEFAEPLRIVSQVTAGALVAGLWQGVLLSVAAALLLRVVPKSTAALRFAVWSAVFCVSVAMPFVDLPGAASAGHANAIAGSHVVFDQRWSYLLSGLWLAASIYRMGELLLQAAGLRALWKSALPVSSERLDGAEMLLRGRRVEVCTSDQVDRPSVIGFFAPRILIPAWLFEQLTVVELNHIVLHEMEHLRRRDDWVNLLQKIGLVLLPLNPALFWIDRRLSTERELACDDGVLERTKMPKAYAASLASIAERRLNARSRLRIGMLALAATGLRQRSELGKRIESILGARGPVNRGLAVAMATIFVVALLGASVELTRIPQLVSFGTAGGLGRLAVAQVDVSSNGRIALVTREKAEKVSFRSIGMGSSAGFPAYTRSVSQRLEPRHKSSVDVTAEAVPLSRTESPAPARSNTEPLAPERGVSSVNTGSSPYGGDAVPAKLFTRKETSSDGRWVVLTSWEDDHRVTRVAVATPDGKFVFVPYAAVPTEAGWLLVQL